MDRKFVAIIAVIVLAFVGITMFTGKDKSASGDAVSTTGSSNYFGKLDSPVTITEFVDFQCEACYAYYPYVKQVKEQYKDQVKFQVRYFPITSAHQFAMQAARTAEAAARQGKFWEMHNKLFEGQKTWEQTKDPTSYFDAYAKEIGLDMTKFKADFASSNVNAVVNKDLADVKALGGDGTPTFAINGKKIENPGPTAETLSKMVEDALKKQGITPKPSPAISTPAAAASSSSGLNPGETQADQAKETQGQ